jgi:putative Mn2+ efflux pump MntP
MEVMQLGEILTLCLMAIALGMDAFSVSIGLGMQGLRLRFIAKVSVINGLFHMLMPLLGILIGRYLSHYLGKLAIHIGGILLIFFGIQMIYSSFFNKEKDSWVSTTVWGIILFSLGVSLDAFSVGLSLGFFAVNMWVSILFFGVSGLVLTALGLLLGRKVSGWMGEYSEALGGMILLVFGIKFLV